MRIVKLTEDTKKDILTNLLKRSPDNYGSYEETVKNIVNDIHSRRDTALFEYTEKFDHAKINADNVRCDRGRNRRSVYTGWMRSFWRQSARQL